MYLNKITCCLFPHNCQLFYPTWEITLLNCTWYLSLVMIACTFTYMIWKIACRVNRCVEFQKDETIISNECENDAVTTNELSEPSFYNEVEDYVSDRINNSNNSCECSENYVSDSKNPSIEKDEENVPYRNDTEKFDCLGESVASEMIIRQISLELKNKQLEFHCHLRKKRHHAEKDDRTRWASCSTTSTSSLPQPSSPCSRSPQRTDDDRTVATAALEPDFDEDEGYRRARDETPADKNACDETAAQQQQQQQQQLQQSSSSLSSLSCLRLQQRTGVDRTARGRDLDEDEGYRGASDQTSTVEKQQRRSDVEGGCDGGGTVTDDERECRDEDLWNVCPKSPKYRMGVHDLVNIPVISGRTLMTLPAKNFIGVLRRRSRHGYAVKLTTEDETGRTRRGCAP